MRNTLIDAGPLIALFDNSDRYHLKALSFKKPFKGVFWMTWPVVAEVSHMLDFSTIAQINFPKWIQRGSLALYPVQEEHIYRLIELTEKFDDVPMDLADASLILVSELTKYMEIISIDSDFYIYRNIRNQYLKNIFI